MFASPTCKTTNLSVKEGAVPALFFDLEVLAHGVVGRIAYLQDVNVADHGKGIRLMVK